MNTKCTLATTLAFAAIVATATANAESTPSAHADPVPAAGFVPDEQTAIRIATAVLEPIYGARNVARHKPLKATLRGNAWIVHGTPPVFGKSGAFEAEISKADGRILRVTDGK